MDTHGAVKIDLSVPKGVYSPFVVRDIPQRTGATTDDFANLVCWYNVPSGVFSVYVGEEFVTKGATPAFPFQIDWRLYHGVGCSGLGGIFDQEPAVGSTFIKSSADLKRQGLLLQFGGLEADSYLLAGRLRGSGDFQLNGSFWGKYTPGLQSSFAAITAGSVIG